MFVRVTSVLLSVIFLSCDNAIAQTNQLVVSLDSDEQQIASIDRWQQYPLHIDHVVFESDSSFTSNEFWYLVQMPAKGLITSDHIQHVCSSLKKKNKFKSITFSINHHENKNVLRISVQALWIFKKVIFDGPLFGKDFYHQYYTLEAADTFDVQKHYHCLAAIKQALHDQGYLNAEVTDYFSYNDQEKTVTVYIIFDPDIRAVIEKISVHMHDVPFEQYSKYSFIERKIQQKLARQLSQTYYAQQQLVQQESWIKKYLSKEGFFAPRIIFNKKVQNHGAHVSLDVGIWPGQQRLCIFEGNTCFSSKQLLDVIFACGDTAYLLPPAILAEQVREFYYKNGFWRVVVTVQEQENCHCFQIQEGKRVCINNVLLHGVSPEHNSAIEKIFNEIKKQPYFNQEIVEQAHKNSEHYYTQAGFSQMHIVKESYVHDHDQNYILEVFFQEGPCSLCHAIEIPNFSYLLAMGPFKGIHKKLPMVMTLKHIDEQRQWLITHFQERGYLYAFATPQLDKNENGYTLVWHLNVQELPTVFGKTIITGNTRLNFDRIINQLPYQEGQLWDKQKLDETIVKLRELGIFETIHVYPDNIGQIEHKKSVVIKLIDDDPFEIRARLGIQQVSKNLTFRSGTTYKAGGSFLYKNPLRLGDFFKIDGDVTRFYRYASGLYVCPWTFDLPVQTTFKAYSNKYTQPVRIGIDKPLYNATQQGFLLGLIHKFNRSFLGFNLGFESMETSGLSQEYANAINFRPVLVDRPVPYIFVEPNIFIDLLDNKVNPTCGSLTVCAFKGMFSWYKGSVNFFKFLCEQSIFIPLDPIVFGMRVRIGHIFNADLSAIMPPERFFLGGENSLRGYEVDLAPPLGIITEEDGKRLLVPQGGKSMVSANFELRFAMYKNFGGTVFQDVGILLDHSLAEITGNKFLAATGFGLRYNTPIGPLRFDLGFKWKRREPEESYWAWFLTLGNAF